MQLDGLSDLEASNAEMALIDGFYPFFPAKFTVFNR